MDVVSQLEQDFIQALKDRNELVVLTLRQIKTAVTNAEIGKNREKLTEAEVIKVLRAEVKKRREASELYEKGNRPELAAKEKKEIEILSHYLPVEVSADVIKQKIGEAITATNAAGPKDIGKVMGLVIKQLPDVDGSVVSRLVKEALPPKVAA